MGNVELNSKSNKICLVVFFIPRFRKSEAFNVISLCIERYRTELLSKTQAMSNENLLIAALM